ncbi:ion transporter [Oxynema sp. CENA135]|uniref:ion transporter n=1 Tax=Oxynema sp. CENA135 TaxID=984206 RepID=UPI00190CCB80|nr:ion transporter [Oxynema sp. CENA135]MBK4731037.1 ion transporter [Oxynema sp. CENA135]
MKNHREFLPYLQRRIYEILEFSTDDDRLSLLDDLLVSLLVIVDVTAFILGTSHSISANLKLFVDEIEIFSVTCFTLLYFLQIWSCTVDPRYADPVWGRLRYAQTPLAIIDLMAILPFYLMVALPDRSSLEFLEIFRLLRLLKLIRYSEALQTILRAVEAKKDELIMTIFAVIILLIFASTIMFFAESRDQPIAFPSIPAAMWWGVVTLTTVGYGDIYPVTPIGKFFGAVLAFVGIGLFALPAGIIASGFSEEVHKRKQHPPLSLEALEHQEKEREAIARYVNESADLMRLCLQIAEEKLGDVAGDRNRVFELAKILFLNTVDRLNLPQFNDSHPDGDGKGSTEEAQKDNVKDSRE